MEIDYTRQQSGRFEAPVLPAQRLESPVSGPQRIPPAPSRHQKQKQRRPIRRSLLVVPLIVALVAGAAGFALYLVPGAIANANVGDCATFDRSNSQQPYSTVRCGGSQAAFVVLQVIQGVGNCRDVAGATRSTVSTAGNVRREICMGPKAAAPAAAVHVAQVGDCLTGTTGSEKRVSCTDPSATVRILKRLNHISTTEVSTACNGVPDATSVYSWTWDTDDGTGPAQASYQTDAVFCLGPIG